MRAILTCRRLDIEQTVTQKCSPSPTLFNIFINQLLEDVVDSGLGVKVRNTFIAAIMFVDCGALSLAGGKAKVLIDLVKTTVFSWTRRAIRR